MSDRPTQAHPDNPDDRNGESGWHAPEQPGTWRVPESAQRSGDETGGWRTPALPTNLDIVPDDRGAWHLPRPEDTVFEPDDEIEVSGTPRATGELPVVDDETVAQAQAGNTETIVALPFDNVVTVAAQPVEAPGADADGLPFEPAVEAAPAEDTLPPDEELAALPFGPDSGPAATIDELVTPGLAYADEDDDTFSMSELIALASLVEDEDAAPSILKPDEPVAPTDPGEYARLQLEKLNATETTDDAAEASTDEPAPEGAAAEADDPADYARRQLERLNQQDAPAAAEAPQAAPTAEPTDSSALAAKFRQTEERVHALRSQYRAGQMSREQLQTELRGLMVLDEQNVWWMLGVETDTWYKFDNGKWVASRPEALGKPQPRPGDRDARELPNLPPVGPQDTMPSGRAELTSDHTVPTGQVQLDDEYMPLPRAVPIRDPDFTLPGNAGLYIPPVPGDLDVTQPTGVQQPTIPTSPASFDSGATVSTKAVTQERPAFVGVPRPDTGAIPAVTTGSEDAPPDYDLRKPAAIYEQALKAKRRSTTRTLAIIGVIGLALLFLLGACGVVGGIIYYSSLAAPYQDAIAGLVNYQPEFQTARILDAEGNLIVELTSREGGARENISLRDVSPFLIHAVISTENERFYDDAGWDPIAIARALYQNTIAGGIESGASTITQQIARSLILQDATVSNERKLQEVVVAAEIAQRYDKNFILELYLNEFFFGNRSYGVEAASQFYFNKSAADLNMAESALIAGLLQAPAAYDPVVNSEAAFGRMDQVLQLMRRQGCLQFQHEPYLGEPFCITDDQIRLDANGNITGGEVLIERALVETRSYRPREYTIRYPHFVNFVQAQVEQAFGTTEMYRRGFTVRTTLLPRIQDTAQQSLARHVQAASSTGINTGAVLVAEPATGAIRAMVGSPDFNNAEIDGQVNNILTWQQPGSAIKPIVYAAALEGVDRGAGIEYLTPASIIWDVPTTYPTNPPYAPPNYDGRFHGPQAVRYALQNSYNVPAVKVFDFIGPEKFVDIAARMGLMFQDSTQFGLPSALGANEVRLYDLVEAYGVLATGGRRVQPFAITSITDAAGNQVEIPPHPEGEQVISPQVAFLLQNILSDNQARSSAFGLNSGLTIPEYDGMVAAKTGTTNDSRDLWTMGFTNNMIVGVWTGTVDNGPTRATTGTAAIPIWNEVMRTALQGNPPAPFPDPGGLVAMQICADTGTAYDNTQQCGNVRSELFIQNQPPPPASQAFLQTAAIDTWTGQRANQYCSENVEMRTVINISDPTAVQWLTSADGQAVAQAMGIPAEAQSLPGGECSPNTQLPNIRITSPAEGQQVQGQVDIVGATIAPNFNRYQLEVASLNSPDNYVIVAGPFTDQRQPGTSLGTWDTTSVPNGLYRLRLSAFANDGGYVYKTIQLGVNNVAPTAMPTSIPVATLAPGESPLPFETPLPFDSQAILPPTQTPAVPGL